MLIAEILLQSEIIPQREHSVLQLKMILSA